MAKQALSPEFLSKLNARSTIWKSLYHFNLSGDDDLVSKGIHVHLRGLKGKSEQWVKSIFSDVIKLCEDPKDTTIEIRWIDDDAAFAILPDGCKAPLSEKIASANCADNVKLTSWDTWLSAKKTTDCSATEEAKEPAQKRARTE